MAVIRFTAPKPYQDIGFRIIDKPWDRKRTRIVYDRGILQYVFCCSCSPSRFISLVVLVVLIVHHSFQVVFPICSEVLQEVKDEYLEIIMNKILDGRSRAGCSVPGRLTTSGRTNPSISCRASNLDLLRAVGEQFNKEASWVRDLVVPLAPWVGDELSAPSGGSEDNPQTRSPIDLARDDPRSKFAIVDGVQMHYQITESSSVSRQEDPDAPVIVMLHGFNASLHSFRGNVQGLADRTGLRVISFDRPPFGLSGRPLKWGPGEELAFDPYADSGSRLGMKLVKEVLGFARNKLILVGHSAGSLTALLMHEISPDDVAGLVFVAPALPATPEHSFQRQATFGTQMRIVIGRAIMSNDETGVRYVRRMIQKQRNDLLENGLDYQPHPSTSSTYQSSMDTDTEDGDKIREMEVIKEMEVIAEREAIEGYLRPLESPDWDKGALLNLRSFWLPQQYDYSILGHDLPVQVVVGATDRLTPAGKALYDILQGQKEHVELVEFENCGHCVMEIVPGEFNEAVVDFIDRQVMQRR